MMRSAASAQRQLPAHTAQAAAPKLKTNAEDESSLDRGGGPLRRECEHIIRDDVRGGACGNDIQRHKRRAAKREHKMAGQREGVKERCTDKNRPAIIAKNDEKQQIDHCIRQKVHENDLRRAVVRGVSVQAFHHDKGCAGH